MMWLLQKIPLGFSITNMSISRLGGAFGLSYLKRYFNFSLLSLCKKRKLFCGHQLFLRSLLLPERLGQQLQYYYPLSKSNYRYPEQFRNDSFLERSRQ